MVCDSERSCSVQAVAKFKLEHLETLKDNMAVFLDNSCLGELSLPKLRDLTVHIMKKFKSIEIPRIERTTLDKLAKNCPKLLRVFGDYPTFGEIHSFLFAQRINGETLTFRRVKEIRKMVNDHHIGFDDDSAESCSDYDERRAKSYSDDDTRADGSSSYEDEDCNENSSNENDIDDNDNHAGSSSGEDSPAENCSDEDDNDDIFLSRDD
jgi:hypothetical protein